ncbi:TPA: plasmid recombination protein, partial [Escherichia coli]|nr:plasmid recombination protein [Escherichia coli]
MKFTFAVAKMSKADIGRAQGHNLRLHETSSQLPKRAWFTASPMHTKVEWDQGKLDAASALAKRKDAVVAIEFIIQVGNQTDWREDPTPECPEGPPIERDLAQFFAPFGEQVKAWADQEFGPENVVSIQLHMDESTPHFHVIATPIKDGKLQAKAWLDGGSKL